MKYFIILGLNGIYKCNIKQELPNKYGVYNIFNKENDVSFYFSTFYPDLKDVKKYFFITSNPKNGWNNQYFPKFKGDILVLNSFSKGCLFGEEESERIINFFTKLTYKEIANLI